ncbi:MAG: AAA family ATPase [Aureispira sp.]
MSHSDLSNADLPMINLIIGKNDVGKTGLLKLLYASTKALQVHGLKNNNGNSLSTFKEELSNKMLTTFMPAKGLGDLVQKGSSGKAEINIRIEDNAAYSQSIYYSFGEQTTKKIPNCNKIEKFPSDRFNSLFLPPKEVLTAFNDIRNIRENIYGTGFDDTYYDLIKALALPVSKGRVASELSTVNKELEDLFQGKIQQTKDEKQPFVFKKGNQKFSMHQTAEGIKKIGILNTLIANRQLGKGTILFLDEPETTLHPDAVRKLIEMLVSMSKAGVQIFMASHSYFVIKQLAICASRDKIDALCWNLKRTEEDIVQAQFTNLIEGILPENSIINESLAMFDQELNVDLDA